MCEKNGITPLVLMEGDVHLADLLIMRGASFFARMNETVSCEDIVDSPDVEEKVITGLRTLTDEFTQHSLEWYLIK